MRQATVLMISFFSAGLLACEQTKTIAANEDNLPELITVDSTQTDIYAYLKDSLGTDWLRENPELENTKISFFDKTRAENYFVAPIQISGFSIPFAWDDDLSILKFLLSRDDEIKTLEGTEADPNYKGIKIKWEQALTGLLWVNDGIYKAPIRDWHLIKETDCSGTINFPNLSFEKQFDAPNAINNRLEGIAIIPFPSEIDKVSSSEISLKTRNGMMVDGKAFDINDDGVSDIFIYDEAIDDTSYYSRLYLNIDGKWVCKYVKLDEVCI